jgi:hypothetical protein
VGQALALGPEKLYEICQNQMNLKSLEAQSWDRRLRLDQKNLFV